MIHTSVIELIKTDVDVKNLINNGLLKSIDNIPVINAWAENILQQKFDERCKMIIGPGNSKKFFQCRKLHSVRDSPYPTRHCYIPIIYQYQKTILEVLEDIGIYITYSKENKNLPSGTFTH